MSSLPHRLRERQLVQWALAYLGGAWLLLQVLDLLGDTFDWPRAIMRSSTVVLAVGFLAALVLAWYHGEQGRQRVSGAELLMLAALLLLAGVGLAWLRREAGATASASREAAVPAPPAPGAADRQSIAVLPFANLSESKENEYFSDESRTRSSPPLATWGICGSSAAPR